jgi:hypothetical protein
MREYSTREDAEQDPELGLMIVWTCDKCGKEREEYPHWNEGGDCNCGGTFFKSGESYNSL